MRNPVTKLLSAWRYCESTKNKPIIYNLENPPKEEENLHDWNHFTCSQTNSLIYNGKKQYDKVFKYENYVEIINYLGRIFDTSLNMEYKNVGDYHSCPKNAIFNKNELKTIYEFYKDDFTNFEYPKPF